MRDSRDPRDLYEKIQHEMRTHHCSILEAADRVELHRNLSPEAQKSTSLTASLTIREARLALDLPPENGREKGAQ